MIDHQKQTLTESSYASMGISRGDQEYLRDVGHVSGYALEILNRKSNGTFDRIRTTVTRSIRRLVNMTLDMTAFMREAPLPNQEDILEEPHLHPGAGLHLHDAAQVPVPQFWLVDPEEV